MPAGRLVVEIFEDQLPTTCRHLMNRCREGMEDTFKNTVIHKIIPDLAAFGGQSRGYACALCNCNMRGCVASVSASKKERTPHANSMIQRQAVLQACALQMVPSVAADCLFMVQ